MLGFYIMVVIQSDTHFLARGVNIVVGRHSVGRWETTLVDLRSKSLYSKSLWELPKT